MHKNYFLTYGSDLKQEELIIIFKEKFDFVFVLRDSSYIGEYCTGHAICCDELIILGNILPDDESYVEDSDKKTILSLSFTDDNNANNKSKYQYMKSQISKLADIVLLKDEVLKSEID